RHAGAGSTFPRTPQQLSALLVPAQLIGSPCRAQEVHQRLAVMLGSNLQVGQSAAPLPLGQLAQAIARSLGDTALAVATRPGIDQRSRELQHTQNPVHQHHQQPDDEYQPDQNPEAGLIAKAVIADQYVAGVLGDGPADCTNDGEQDDEEQSKPLHVRRSSSLGCSSSPAGASSASTGSSPWPFWRLCT